MAWPSGVSKDKTGGRKVGTPNRRTAALIDKLEGLRFDPLHELIRLLPELTPREKSAVCLQMLPYLYPRRKAVDVAITDVKLQSDDKSEELIKKIQAIIAEKADWEKEL